MAIEIKGRHTDNAILTLEVEHLRGADLSCADLSVADLRDADLSGADLSGADLRGAKGAPSLTAAQTLITPEAGAY